MAKREQQKTCDHKSNIRAVPENRKDGLSEVDGGCPPREPLHLSGWADVVKRRQMQEEIWRDSGTGWVQEGSDNP